MKFRVSSLVLIAILILGVSVLAQFLPKRVKTKFPPVSPLTQLLPGRVDGWSVTELPLGETEYVKQKVEEILRYDDYAFKLYKQGDIEIGFYVAFWKPGSSDIIEVGGHSPDLCWPQNGWSRVGAESEQSFSLEGRNSEVAQTRKFIKDGQVQHTAFWHLMGGKRTGYAQGDQTRWTSRAPVILRNLVNTKFGFIQMEQYFIRFTSNKPIEQIAQLPIFAELLKASSQFGTFETVLQ